MVAMQLAHEPLVRQVVREAIIDRLKLSCAPTKRGFKVRFCVVTVARYLFYFIICFFASLWMNNVNLVVDVQEIDEAHNCYTSRYLVNKPIQTLYALQFSHIFQVSLFTELVKNTTTVRW